MSDTSSKPRWSLPYESPLPVDPRRAGRVRALRVAACALLAAALIAPVVQFQHGTVKRERRRQGLLQKVESGKIAAEDVPIVGTKGAIARWSKAVRQFWAGRNIYQAGQADADRSGLTYQQRQQRDVWLHPNMPFTVIMLSPFAYMPIQWQALSVNVLKLLVLAATGLMAASLAGHGRRRICDWVLGLGVLWALFFLIGDIQHGNTNVFVLGLVTCHLWLYRRGRDGWAGLPLACAICLKMTPALFVLYWLYQRNWKLLSGTLVWLVMLAVAVPAAAIGPQRYWALTQTWLDNLIIPGLLKGAWYPIHINQSLSGVLSRYFLDGKWGDILWNPDDAPWGRGDEHSWITLIVLPHVAVKMILRAGQIVIVALAMWAIGLRKLPRDDGRRALHYGLVVLGMMLLNQRTWDHHATVVLLATVAIWQAIAFGRMAFRPRAWSLALTILAGLCVFLTRGDLLKTIGKAIYGHKDKAELFADRVEAAGPAFWAFAMLFVSGVILSLALKKSAAPYADTRQKLFVKG